MSDLSPPQQLRSLKTLTAISSATKKLLKTHTFAELTIGQIIKEAGSSTGSFYARFKGKRALLHHLHEEYAQDSKSQVQHFVELMDGKKLPLDTFTEVWVPEVVQSHYEHRGLIRAAMIETFDDPQFAIRAGKLLHHIATKLAQIISDPLNDNDAHILNIAYSMRAIMAILDQDLFYLREGKAHKPSDEQIARLKRIFEASMNTTKERNENKHNQ